MASYFRITRVPVDAVSWTPIVASIDCSRIVIEAADLANGLSVRSDPADPLTQKDVPAGMEFDLRSFAATAPFIAGTTIVYAQAVAGVGPAVVSCTR